MSLEFGVCKFYTQQGDCLVFDGHCEECFSVEKCSDILRSVDDFVEFFNNSADDKCKSNVLSLLYAKFRAFYSGKE